MNVTLTKGNIIILSIFLLFTITLFGIIKLNEKSDNSGEINQNVLLSDYSRFFTLEKCVNNYLNYLSIKDSDSLIKLIDNTYLSNNNLNKNNLFTKIKDVNMEFPIFIARKIIANNINDNLVKYYIAGEISEDIMDEYHKSKNYYLIINFNPKTFIYSVIPYEGQIFMEGL